MTNNNPPPMPEQIWVCEGVYEDYWVLDKDDVLHPNDSVLYIRADLSRPRLTDEEVDVLKRDAVKWYKERFDNSDIIGMPSDREVLFGFIDHLRERGII